MRNGELRRVQSKIVVEQDINIDRSRSPMFGFNTLLLPFDLLKEMQWWDLEPNAISYKAAFCACEKGSERLLPFELFNKVRPSELSILPRRHQCM